MKSGRGEAGIVCLIRDGGRASRAMRLGKLVYFDELEKSDGKGAVEKEVLPGGKRRRAKEVGKENGQVKMRKKRSRVN